MDVRRASAKEVPQVREEFWKAVGAAERKGFFAPRDPTGRPILDSGHLRSDGSTTQEQLAFGDYVVEATRRGAIENDGGRLAIHPDEGESIRRHQSPNMLWVSRGMTRAAIEASFGAPVSLDQLLFAIGEGNNGVAHDSGFIYCEGGLPPMPGGNETGDGHSIPYGFFWSLRPTTGKTKERGVDLIVTFTPFFSRFGGYGGPARPREVQMSQTLWAERLDGTVDLSSADEYCKGFLAFLVAAYTMSAQPTVASVRSKTVPGQKIKGQRRRQAPSEVKIVELRQMKHQTATHSPSGRQYSHRWIVRGHWRDQACGPGNKLRRRTWVPAYTKGPDGAPLLEKETVFAWRR